MSEKKKVIHVKDLVIKADNVEIQPPHRPPRPVDPFFGPRREEEGRHEEKEEYVAEEEEHEKHEDEGDDRRPFSWI